MSQLLGQVLHSLIVFCFVIFWSTHLTYISISREIKERIKKTKDEKKAKKAEVMAKTQKTSGKGNVPKGAAPRGSKLGGGGKR